jgi:hypothetical protein
VRFHDIWAKARTPKADEFAQKAKDVLVFPNVIGVDRKRGLLKVKGHKAT